MSTAPSKHAWLARAVFGFAAAAAVVLPSVLASAVPVPQGNGAQVTAVAAAAPTPAKPAADSSPSCPGAYFCLQSGTDPQTPYGTDPFVPYGTNMGNSRVPFGSGSNSYTGGAF